MQLSTVILSVFAAAASAAPSCGQRKFGIMALRSASPIHFATVSATKNKLVLNLPEDQVDSECVDGKVHSAATFYIKDEELYLYGTKDRVQQFLVDPSGMGKDRSVLWDASSVSLISEQHSRARCFAVF